MSNFADKFKKDKPAATSPNKASVPVESKAGTQTGSFADKAKKSSTGQEFVDVAKRADGDRIFLVTGQNQGKDAWYYVLVEKTKLPLFKQKVQTEFIDLSEYGEILYCGWGKEPPEDISDKIKKDYY